MRDLLSTSLLLLLYSPLLSCTGDNTLQPGETLNVTQAITSDGGSFALGFFTLGNSTSRYVGIWYNKIKEQTVVWVANRENQLTDSTGFLTLSADGNLKLLDGKKSVLWPSNLSVIDRNSTTAVLLDNGNLVLKTMTNMEFMWQSFENPIASFIPGMKLSLNLKTGQSIRVLSWKDVDDPTPGEFSVGIDPQTPRQLVVWRGSKPYWGGDIWQQVVSSGVFQSPQSYVGFRTIIDTKEEISYLLTTSENSFMIRAELTPTGKIELRSWVENSQKWILLGSSQGNNNCSFYGWCGPYGSCYQTSLPTVCKCLKGFRPKFQKE